MACDEFPSIIQLPQLVRSTGWHWEQRAFGLYAHNFWVGTDQEGRHWLVKMRGKYDAVRERVYASLSQHVGICTQSSSYLLLANDAPPLHDAGTARPMRVPHQAAILQIEEHGDMDECEGCPLKNLQDTKDAQAYFRSWVTSGIKNPWDYFDATMLGYLCAKHEPTGTLITTDHSFVGLKMISGLPNALMRLHSGSRRHPPRTGAWQDGGEIPRATRSCRCEATRRGGEVPSCWTVIYIT